MAHIDGSETQRANLAFIKRSMREPLLSRDREFELRAAGARTTKRPARAGARLYPAGDQHRVAVPQLRPADGRSCPGGQCRADAGAACFEPAARCASRPTRPGGSARPCRISLRNWSIVRTGTTAAQKSLFFNCAGAGRIEEASSTRLTHDGREKVARELNVNVGDVESMEMRMSGGDQSLNTPMTPRRPRLAGYPCR